MLGNDFANFDEWVDEWQKGFERTAARANELSGRMRELTATASDPEGLVELTVDSSRVMTGLRLDDRVRDRAAPEIAELIMAAMHAALAELSRKVTEATSETLGLDSEAGRAIVDSYTPPPEPGDGR